MPIISTEEEEAGKPLRGRGTPAICTFRKHKLKTRTFFQ